MDDRSFQPFTLTFGDITIDFSVTAADQYIVRRVHTTAITVYAAGKVHQRYSFSTAVDLEAERLGISSEEEIISLINHAVKEIVSVMVVPLAEVPKLLCTCSPMQACLLQLRFDMVKTEPHNREGYNDRD
jgi:hypothetical protein